MQSDLKEFAPWLFTQECVFMRGVDKISSVPEASFPEIAFAGRSNVGKSSLINALLGRVKLARVSNTPGRTQQLNFFLLAHRLVIVDMPGYGYAAVSKEKLKLFSNLIQDYLKGRAPLKRVFLLIDSRHGLKPPDVVLMSILDKGAVSYQIVLTKEDKCTSSHLDSLLSSLRETLKRHPAAFPEPLLTSSETKKGLSSLRETIAELTLN